MQRSLIKSGMRYRDMEGAPRGHGGRAHLQPTSCCLSPPAISAWVHPIQDDLGLDWKVIPVVRRTFWELHMASPGESQLSTSPLQPQTEISERFSECQPLGVRLKLLIPNHYNMGIRLLLMTSNGLLVSARHFLSMKDFSPGLGFVWVWGLPNSSLIKNKLDGWESH